MWLPEGCMAAISVRGRRFLCGLWLGSLPDFLFAGIRRWVIEENEKVLNFWKTKKGEGQAGWCHSGGKSSDLGIPAGKKHVAVRRGSAPKYRHHFWKEKSLSHGHFLPLGCGKECADMVRCCLGFSGICSEYKLRGVLCNDPEKLGKCWFLLSGKVQ